MKKLISLLCVAAMVISVMAVAAVGASAAVDAAKTQVDVKKGQDVTYRLKLSDIDSKVIGSDFSIYYDPAVLEVVSVLDFNDNDEENWEGSWVCNPNKSGEVLVNFSVIRGLKFDEPRSYITVKFKAKADASTEISYFIRYLYDYKIFIEELQKSKPQITKFKLTCDVSVDGDPVIEDAQPELNVDVPQDHGSFINSVTGDSSDIDPDIAGTSVNRDKAVEAREAYDSVAYDPAEEGYLLYGGEEPADSDNGAAPGSNSGANSDNSGNSGNAGGSSSSAPAVSSAPAATTKDGYYITATDGAGNVTATSDEAPVVTTGTSSNKGGSSPVIWIIIVLVVLAGGGAAAYFAFKKKKAGAPAADTPADGADKTTEAPENKE